MQESLSITPPVLGAHLLDGFVLEKAIISTTFLLWRRSRSVHTDDELMVEIEPADSMLFFAITLVASVLAHVNVRSDEIFSRIPCKRMLPQG